MNTKKVIFTLLLINFSSFIMGCAGLCVSSQFSSKITFDDVTGLAQAKKELSPILKYVENPEKWEQAGISNKQFYILSGSSRSGRSYMTEALCGEIHKILKQQNRCLDEIKLLHVEQLQAEKIGIPMIMQQIKAHAPCILFIDDARVAFDTNHRDFFADIITAVHGCKEAVIILAATRYPLEKGFKGGKLVNVVHFDYPIFSDRKEYIAQKLRTLPFSQVARDLAMYNIDKLASITDGASYNCLEHLLRAAFQKSKIYHLAFTQELLEQTFIQEFKSEISDPIQEGTMQC